MFMYVAFWIVVDNCSVFVVSLLPRFRRCMVVFERCSMFQVVWLCVWLCVVCFTVLGDVWFVSIRCSIAHRVIDVLLALFL